MEPVKSSRELAILCLCAVEDKRLLVNEAMDTLPHALDTKALAFAHEIIMGTCRFRPGLMAVLRPYIRNWDKLPSTCQWLLLSATYQILVTKSPDYAVLNEANQLTGRLRIKGLKPLVNAVLRRVTQHGRDPWHGMSNKDKTMPVWLSQAVTALRGDAFCQRLAETWSVKPNLYGWSEHSGDGRWPPNAVKVEDVTHFLTRGYVQNISSQAICELVMSVEGTSLLDMCAAPGGKCLYLARFSEWEITATDIQSDRLLSVQANASRLGLADRLSIVPWDQVHGYFDMVLVDAPCSAVGIIARHPEIVLHRETLADSVLLKRQSDLLERAWSFVRAGGRLIYSVCSWDPREVPNAPTGSSTAPELNAWAARDSAIEVQGDRFSILPDTDHDGFCGAMWEKSD